MLWKFVLLSLLLVNVLGIHLGIQKDFTDKDDIVSYSGIIRFNQDDFLKGFTDNRVANLLRRAYAEMEADFQQRQLQAHRLPGAMIAFVTQNTEIYFASSMKGGDSIFIQEPRSMDDPLGRFDAIRGLLRACQFGTHPGTHNYYGRCGEPSVVELYMSRHGGYLDDNHGRPMKGRIFAWHGPQQRIIVPCWDGKEGDGRYGCSTFLDTHLPRVTQVLSANPDATGENDLDFTLVTKTWRRYTCKRPKKPEEPEQPPKI